MRHDEINIGVVTSGPSRAEGDALTPSVEYSRRLYDDVLGWYHNADAKAHVLLGLDGAFVTFVAATAFRKPEELSSLLPKFTPWTWGFLGLMTASLVASIASAIYCLWSRVYLRPSSFVHSTLAKAHAVTLDTYPPGTMWFFQFISGLNSAKFQRTLFRIDSRFEIEALASQISILSNNVRKKHIGANVGFVLAIATLLLFGAAAASYVMAAL
jgi:hypothetical protein